MGQPRSRNNVERPLIIERPDLAHPVRRVLAFVITLLAWIGFLAIWLPVLDIAAVALDLPIPSRSFPSPNHALALRSLFNVFPFAIGLMILVLAVNGVINWIYKHLAKPKVHRFIGMEQLATGLALDKDKVSKWQGGRILHVEHGPLGRVINAEIIR